MGLGAVIGALMTDGHWHEVDVTELTNPAGSRLH